MASPKAPAKTGAFLLPAVCYGFPVMNPFGPIYTGPSFALFGDIGGGEILVVLAAILVLFGGKGLPTMARTLGKIMGDLQRISQDFKHQLLNADQEPPHRTTPRLPEPTPTEPYDSAAQDTDTKPPQERPPSDLTG